MKPHLKTGLLLALLATLSYQNLAIAGAKLFAGTGAAATTEFTNFKTAIKSATTQDGSLINWDAVKLDGTDANPNTRVIQQGKTVEIPIDRFKVRGVIFADPYTVSGDGFAAANPATTGQFPAFTPSNTFAMFDNKNGEFKDRKIEQSFVLVNTTTGAGTRGFGAIFLDVEQEGSSSIEYFGRDAANNKISLGKFYVKPSGKSGEPQFLGVLFDAPVVSDVEITPGARALFSFDSNSVKAFGAENLAQGIDLAVTDDFIFAVPETLKTSTAKVSEADCLFNWAEKTLADYFPANSGSTQTWAPYRFRYYNYSKSYVGISYSDYHLYYLGPNGVIQDVGAAADWFTRAQCW